MKTFRLIIHFLFLILASNAFAKNIKLLNWWDYLDASIVEQEKSEGFNINLGVYKSNDVAVGKLISNKDQYDVAILSNQVIGALAASNIILPNNVEDKSKYYDFLVSNNNLCVPYMWSVTVFATNSNKIDEAPKVESISDLLNLKKAGYSIGVIDDKLEVVARIFGDISKECNFSNKADLNKSVINRCWKILRKKQGKQLVGSMFVNSVYEILDKAPSAVYGWHGEIAPALASKNRIRLELPKYLPVLGYDSVCIINKKRSSKELLEIKRFIKILTDQKSANIMAKKTQYFSPYKDSSEGLRPEFKKLLFETQIEINKMNYQVLSSPSEKEHIILNEFWKAVRYGQ
jgi:spermidine/putrescine-binding protein